MTLFQVSGQERKRHIGAPPPCGFSRGIVALILFMVWLLSASAMARPQAAENREDSARTTTETGRSKPAQTSTDSAEIPGTKAGDADEQSGQAQTGQQSPTQIEIDKAKKNGAESEEKKGEWLIVPIPIINPAIGAGLQWAVGRVFPINKKDNVSPNSAVGVGGVITNNGSRVIALGGRVYLKEDKYRFATGLGAATVNADFYGIGKQDGDEGIAVPLKFDGGGFVGEFLYGLKKGVFIGVKGQYRNLTLSLNQEELNSSDIALQPPDKVATVIDEISDQFLHQQTASIGPRFEWDSRDNVYYPKHGLFMDIWVDLFAEGLGSRWTYQSYRAAFNKYNKVGGFGVFAVRGMACAAAGDHVPLYDLCLFGSMNDIRGYTAGRYQDRRMFAAQGEYRFMLPAKGFLGRFGVVGFFGFGGVGKTFSDIGWNDLLPGGGAGLRFRLTKKNPINYRVDYAFGKEGNTLTIGVLEAF